MDPELRTTRFARVRSGLAREGARALVVPASADFRWLTGAPARVSERLVAFVLPFEGEPFVLVPRLEADALEAECPWLEAVVWDEHQDPVALLSSRLGLERRPPLLLGEGFRTSQLLALAAATPCRPATPVLASLRAVKDAAELRLLEEASRHADRIVGEAAAHARPGITERELERWILTRFDEAGDTDAWAIVASGPNSAFPHHTSSSRVVAEGDVLLLDLGASHRGYQSDITRTFWVGTPHAEAEEVYGIVDRARQAGIAAVRAGALQGDVDRAARSVIEGAGYGRYFPHRTGHGVGLEIHEAPYLVAGGTAPLEQGMVHSVEPGIYLPGRFGIRLEDLVVVEEGGARRLNHAPFEPGPARVRG
jgi:Xaa-Pro aminopeptidase